MSAWNTNRSSNLQQLVDIATDPADIVNVP
ncbi:hypothetical protein SAMN04488590_0183 [Microbacterium sp. 77mftsu3.1]|nr:hypothetical protein SAMN04488590_0183 [Microbacterium sp. 77mftsu3.1]